MLFLELSANEGGCQLMVIGYIQANQNQLFLSILTHYALDIPRVM